MIDEYSMRVWCKKEKWMVDNVLTSLIHDTPNGRRSYRTQDYFTEDNFIVVRTTELRDFHGKMIFEKDIIRADDGYYLVLFYDGCFMTQEISADHEDYLYNKLKTTKCVVIGNLYENHDISPRLQKWINE